MIVKEDVEGGVVDTRPITGAHYGVLNVGRFTVLTVSCMPRPLPGACRKKKKPGP